MSFKIELNDFAVWEESDISDSFRTKYKEVPPEESFVIISVPCRYINKKIFSNYRVWVISSVLVFKESR